MPTKNRIVIYWGARDIQQLRAMHDAGDFVEEMAEKLGRTVKAIEGRLYHMRLKPRWQGPRQ